MRKLSLLLTVIIFFTSTMFPDTEYSEEVFFERPLAGSTGWTMITQPLRLAPDSSASSEGQIEQGEAFCIIDESGSYWRIYYDNAVYYVEHAYCMINLPDVIPSAQFNITNSYSSMFRTSYQEIPGLTGEKLYSWSRTYNYRLDREEFIAPMLYSSAKLVAKALHLAKEVGYTIKIYDTYRPHSVTTLAAQRLREDYNTNPSVRPNIDYDEDGGYWGQGWFLAQSVSSHNTGTALDVTLVNLETGQENEMHSPMHELSTISRKRDNDELNRIFTSVGMAGIQSEWWHFQDNSGRNRIMSAAGALDFQINELKSIKEYQAYYYINAA